MTKLFFIPLIIVLFFSAAFAQKTDKTVSRKIVFVNKLAFSAKTTEIKKLVIAESNFNPGFYTTRDEQQIQEIYKRAEQTQIEPVIKEIFDVLKLVEIQNNIIILDAVELEEKGQLLSLDERFDITNKFIAYFNNKARMQNAVSEFDIPESKIAVVNTEIFYDNEKGIKNLFKLSKNLNEAKKLCVESKLCVEIGNAINSFGKKKGYSLILDSSKEIPKEINSYQMTDVTQEFISEFNQSNQ